MGFQDRKKHDNVEKEKAHLLSLEVPLSFSRKVSVHATLYDRKTEEYPFPGTLGQSEGCLTIQKTALNWGCGTTTSAGCSGSRHHHFGSSSSQSDLLISSVRRRNCPGNRLTAQPSPNGRGGSRQSPGGNRSPKHSWFHQTAVGTTSPLSINPSPTRAPATKVATPNAPNR